MPRLFLSSLLLSVWPLSGCKGEAPQLDVESWAKGCYTLRDGETWLAASSSGTAYAFSSDTAADAARFFMQPSDPGTYLF